jgi:DNA modification methylase
MPDKCVDLVLTDPPYGVDLGSHKASVECRSRWLAKKKYGIYDDTYENYKNLIVPRIVESIRISKRAMVFCAGTRMWDLPKPDAVGGVYLPAACGRNCWGFNSLAHVLFYGKCPDLNLGSKHTAISSTESSEKNGHPCPKPIGWMLWLIDLGSRPGETVFDPFLGSGTTLKACIRTGRIGLGCELDATYEPIIHKNSMIDVQQIDDSKWF